MIMLLEKKFLEIIYNIREGDLSNLFLSKVICEGYQISHDISKTYEKRKELFLWCLQKALDDGFFRLAKHGFFLEGTNDEQVQLFGERLPAEEGGLDNGIWFFLEECPGGIVWILDYELGDLTEPIGDGKFYYWT